MPMTPDFIFVDPNKIPPRRSVKYGGSCHNVKLRRIPKARENFEVGDNNEEDEASFPEFVLNPGEFQVHFASHSEENFQEDEVKEKADPLTDPLTEEIFFAPKPRPLPSPPPVFESTSGNIPYSPNENLNPVQASSIFNGGEESRDEILAELEKIDLSDAELFKKIKRLNAPKRSSKVNLAGSFQNKSEENANREIKMRFFRQKVFGGNHKVFFDSEDGFDQSAVRAQDDWFQVRLSANEKISRIKNLAEEVKNEKYDGFGEEEFEIQNRRGKNEKKDPRVFIAILFIILIPAVASVFLFSSRQNFFKNFFSSINSKLLGSSSFVIVNSENSLVFPGVSEAKAKLAGSGVSEETGTFFDNFFEENSSFGWMNIFKKKAVGQSAGINGLDFLEKAKENIKSVSNPSLDSVGKDLEKEIAKLDFWNRFLSLGNQYLVVLNDSGIQRPSGGKPIGYAVVRSDGERLETIGSGKFLVIDAASGLKIIPPDPIKPFSTAWLPSDSGWFLDFSESGKTFAVFFEDATQLKVDGVLSLDKIFLKEVSFRESLIFDIESPNWFYGFVGAIERKPNYRWAGLADELGKAVKSRKIQFYFRDERMNKYARDFDWFVSANVPEKNDALGVRWAAFEGNGIELELIESRVGVNSDGSLFENLNVMMKQETSGASKSYFKIYIPKNSEITKVSGFSEKEKIPEFDYIGGGFVSDRRIKKTLSVSDESWNADVFEESGLTVVGGWIDAGAGERKKISLEYKPPFKLSRDSKGVLTYNSKIFKPLQDSDVPFRFNLLPKEGVEIISLEPNGFITENLGEYQGTLGSDLNLSASLRN